MYATIAGLAKWYGISVEALAEKDPAAERNLEGVEARMIAYIIPNSPRGDAQVETMALAIYHQYDYEQSEAAKQLMQSPAALTSFSLGNWSASFGARKAGDILAHLFPAGISSPVYAILLSAGLLFRGVNTC